jgi:hypothetical protein
MGKVTRTVPNKNKKKANTKARKTSLGDPTPARVNQQPPMHQLVVLSCGWVVFFHMAPNEVHHDPFFFATEHCIYLFLFLFIFLLCDHFPPRLDFTPSYLAHFPTLISTTPTLVPYLLSLIDITTLITSYPIDLFIIPTTYPTNLATLHTQPLY